jgi:hypothetical protein
MIPPRKNAPNQPGWIKYLEIIPFDVWIAAACCVVMVFAFIFEPPFEVILTIFVLGAFAVLFEIHLRNPPEGDL